MKICAFQDLFIWNLNIWNPYFSCEERLMYNNQECQMSLFSLMTYTVTIPINIELCLKIPKHSLSLQQIHADPPNSRKVFIKYLQTHPNTSDHQYPIVFPKYLQTEANSELTLCALSWMSRTCEDGLDQFSYILLQRERCKKH